MQRRKYPRVASSGAQSTTGESGDWSQGSVATRRKVFLAMAMQPPGAVRPLPNNGNGTSATATVPSIGSLSQMQSCLDTLGGQAPAYKMLRLTDMEGRSVYAEVPTIDKNPCSLVVNGPAEVRPVVPHCLGR